MQQTQTLPKQEETIDPETTQEQTIQKPETTELETTQLRQGVTKTTTPNSPRLTYNITLETFNPGVRTPINFLREYIDPINQDAKKRKTKFFNIAINPKDQKLFTNTLELLLEQSKQQSIEFNKERAKDNKGFAEFYTSLIGMMFGGLYSVELPEADAQTSLTYMAIGAVASFFAHKLFSNYLANKKYPLARNAEDYKLFANNL